MLCVAVFCVAVCVFDTYFRYPPYPLTESSSIDEFHPDLIKKLKYISTYPDVAGIVLYQCDWCLCELLDFHPRGTRYMYEDHKKTISPHATHGGTEQRF